MEVSDNPEIEGASQQIARELNILNVPKESKPSNDWHQTQEVVIQ